MNKKYDFSGWATKNNLRCSDGRTIMKDAFKSCDGVTVPMVWNHQHNDAMNVLGHAILENRENGVYAYGTFNDTESGKNAKLLVEHGDIDALSIWANDLKQQGSNVVHGAIRELSFVLAGANPGAYIDSIMSHGVESEEEAIIYTGENVSLYHSEGDPKKGDPKKEDGETIADVFNTMSEKQKTVVYAMIGEALDEKADTSVSHSNVDNLEGGSDMKHNVFEQTNDDGTTTTLSHADMTAIIEDAKHGSLRDSVLSHGIDNIEYLFPDAKAMDKAPQFIKRKNGWVNKVMTGTHHTPFSRIKSRFADITGDEARARGYIKGNQKKDEVFTLLKRTTSPTTIYKKQKLDRDDVVDITDFNVVAWLKTEMRMMLNEEIARAVLVGDGRLGASDDKINESNVRPIWTDEDLFTIKKMIELTESATDDQKAKAFIRACIKARVDYEGSGEPILFCSEDTLTDCLLMEDTTGRVIYDSVTKLATVLRVKEIVTVPVMSNLTRDEGNISLEGIIVDLDDYNIGADKGGAVNMFDDFDIDYNAQKYLIETRCSGALVKPHSAIVVESKIKSEVGA